MKDNKILLEKRAPRFLEGGKWGLLGGFMDRDETLPQSAKREALEESGFEIDDLKLFRIVDNPKRRNEDRQNIVFIYTANVIRKIGKPDDESTEVKWFDLDQLPPFKRFAFDHLEHIHLYMKYLEKPFPLPIIANI